MITVGILKYFLGESPAFEIKPIASNIVLAYVFGKRKRVLYPIEYLSLKNNYLNF